MLKRIGEIVSANLVRLRKERLGLTQAQAADAAGVPLRTYQRAEDPSENMTLETLDAISNGLKIPVIELISEGDDPRERVLDDLFRLLRALAAIDDPKLRRTFLDAVGDLAEGFTSGTSGLRPNERKKAT